MTICNQVPSGMSSYTWTPPFSLLPANTYKVRISTLTSAAGFDFSDGYFTITNGFITVLSPNGGENWQIGTTHQILWDDNICGNVRIELWKGGLFNTVITQSTPSNGNYSWTIPLLNTLVPGSDYKIKILNATNTATTTNLVFDFSDNFFTITPGGYFITVTSPNGGEIWHRGTTRIIKWQDNISWNVRIELWKGGVYHSLINGAAPSSGSCFWAIPSTLPPGNNYKVRISAISVTANFLMDFSDNYFTIAETAPYPGILPVSMINVYPNPCSKIAHIAVDESSGESLSIEMLDMTGKMVFRQSPVKVLKGQTIDLNTQNFPDGRYLLLIYRGNEFISRHHLVILHQD